MTGIIRLLDPFKHPYQESIETNLQQGKIQDK